MHLGYVLIDVKNSFIYLRASMSDINNIKTSKFNKKKSFFCHTIERMEIFCSKFKVFAGTNSKCDSINSIKKLNLPPNIQAELLAKFDTDL